MFAKRLLSVFLAGLLTTTQLIYPISVYADSISIDSKNVDASFGASDAWDVSENTSSESSSVVPDTVASTEQSADLQEDVAVAAENVPQINNDNSAEVPIGLSHVEYVFVDKQVVALGEEQNIVVGFSPLDGALSSARLELKTSDGQVTSVPSVSIAGTALRFAPSFTEEAQALRYTVSKVVYQLTGSDIEYVVDFASDSNQENTYAFDVVTAETAQALESSDDGGVSATVINDEGELEAVDSIEDAINIADGQEVQQSHRDATSPSVSSESNARTRSAIAGTRENYLIVAIDPGHGGYDPGASANGVVEKDVNWSIANHFKNELATYTGVTPYLTTAGEEPSLQARVNRAVSVGADVFVSVHVNSASAAASGAEVWVPNNGSYNNETHVVGKALGEKIENQLAALGLNRRGVFTRDYPRDGSAESKYPNGSIADYYSVIRNARKHGIPGIIVEHAFVTSPSDAAKLKDDGFRKKLGVADATGVAQQYNLGKDSVAKAAASVAVKAHVTNLGWESTVYDHKVAGTTGKNFNLEAFQVSLQNSVAKVGGVQYQAYVGNSWQGWKSNGQTAGTTGQNKAVQAVQMKLTGSAASKYDIWYRVHSAEVGWLGWAKNGASAGTTGYGYGAQAIEVVITAKGAAAPGSTNSPYKEKKPAPSKPDTSVKPSESTSLSYRAHVRNIGWQGWGASQAGTTGRALPIEALQVSVKNAKVSGGVEVRAHVENIGWQGWVKGGAIAGTTGRALQVEAVCLRLTGDLAKQYDIYYRVHVANIGWLGWAKNGVRAGSQGYAYGAEAIQIRLVKKGDKAPGSTSDVFRAPMVQYQGHVQNIGWQSAVRDGSLAGTTGRNLNLEALKVSLGSGIESGGIQVRAHVRNYGWQKWTNGTAGTTGRNTPIEAVQIKLTGDAASKYTVWYRMHSADFGWLGWAKDGESAGSEGYAKSAQAIQIKIVAKNGKAPGSTNMPFRNKNSEAIMGASQATVSQMTTAYHATGASYPSGVYSSKGAKNITEFCKIIDAEAKAEGVRSEIVYAQVMHETGNLQFGGSVKASQCNFGGLGATSSTVGGASFPNVATGIRAQVQHLKAYASTQALKKKCVDPRFNVVKRGSAPTVIDLNGKWAVPGNGYGQALLKISKSVLSR